MGGRHVRETLLDLVDRNAEEHPGVTATVDGESRLSWLRYRERARAIALALLDLGVARGETVGLHMVNRVEHVLADVGAVMAGATPSSYYNTLSDEQLTYVARDSAATVVIVDAGQLKHWQSIRGQLPALRHIVALDLDPDHPAPDGVLRFEDWVDLAEAQLGVRGAEVDTASAKVEPDDALTIVYTSGTTGHPKGTIITHASIHFVLEEVSRQLADGHGGSVPIGWTAVSYLPLAHIAERMFSHYLALFRTVTVTYVRDPGLLPHVLPQVRPYLFFGVPRVWEKIYSTIRERAARTKNPVRRLVGRVAISVAQSAGQAWFDRRLRPPMVALLYPLMERMVYRKIRAVLGLDRVVLAVSGAAQLPSHVVRFFRGIGITIIEVYGMTETAAYLSSSPLDAPRLGTVGRVVPGIEVKIADDGEILAKGPNITPGYLNRPEATAEAIDAEGWLHTGDIGTIDKDNYLKITGRKKELINTASGKTISPGNVEAALSEGSDVIGSVFVFGDDKPCLVALVTLDPSWPSWCKARGIKAGSAAEAVADGRLRIDVARAIGSGNAKLSRVEQVKNWTLLEDVWTSETGELTPTLKLKRSVVAERYRDEIEELYDPLTADAWVDD